jgi:ankyrin repeat protein
MAQFDSTALIEASHEGYYHLVDYLLKAGANKEAVDGVSQFITNYTSIVHLSRVRLTL